MRLTDRQREEIKWAAAESFGDGAHIWLFGSRVHDDRRGGDIDLYVESDLEDPEAALDALLKFRVELTRRLGERKIDVVLRRNPRVPEQPIHRIAKEEGVEL